MRWDSKVALELHGDPAIAVRTSIGRRSRMFVSLFLMNPWDYFIDGNELCPEQSYGKMDKESNTEDRTGDDTEQVPYHMVVGYLFDCIEDYSDRI